MLHDKRGNAYYRETYYVRRADGTHYWFLDRIYPGPMIDAITEIDLVECSADECHGESPTPEQVAMIKLDPGDTLLGILTEHDEEDDEETPQHNLPLLTS